MEWWSQNWIGGARTGWRAMSLLPAAISSQSTVLQIESPSARWPGRCARKVCSSSKVARSFDYLVCFGIIRDRILERSVVHAKARGGQWHYRMYRAFISKRKTQRGLPPIVRGYLLPLFLTMSLDVDVDVYM